MTKEELQNLSKIRKEIELLKEEIGNVEVEFTTDSVKGSSVEFPYTQHSIKIGGVDLDSYNKKIWRIQKKLYEKQNELLDERTRITEEIINVDNTDLRQILIYKYIQDLSWEEIGERMNYAGNTVRMKHDNYIKSLAKNSRQ